MIRLLRDIRDKHYYQKFGQTTEFPVEVNFDTPIYDEVQPVGDVKCTAYTCCEIATDKDDVIYDINDLFNRIPHNQFGADPRDALSETVKNGLLLKGGTQRVKTFVSYWRADTGNYDTFNNVRSTLLKAQYPIAIASPWYMEWQGQTILPEGKNISNYHMYAVEGWKQINNEPHLIIEAWLGHKLYVNREVFNKAMVGLNSSAWVLSTSEIDEMYRKNTLEKIVDVLVNVVSLLNQLFSKKKIATDTTQQQNEVYKPILEVKKEPEVVKRDLLNEFCLAIRDMEGKPGDLNYINKNPGNIRGKSGKFLKFSTMEEGFAYLKDYVMRAMRGEHPAYPKNPTIRKFFSIYAPSSDNNNPLAYAKNVAGKVGLSIDDTLSKLI